jgi:N-acetylmuramoyl-L-alanine amidase
MDLTRRSLALFGATALGGFALGGRAWADAPAAIRDLRLTADDASAMVRLDLDRQAAARTFFLSNPDRFVIDVANARWAMAEGAHGEGPGSGVVRGYRFAPRPDGAGRLVLDLATPLNLVRQEIAVRRDPRLSFGLVAATPLSLVAPKPLEVVPRGADRRPVVVIDPGHGGHDPGALGLTGVREKDVVLDAGLLLRAALVQRGYRVAMTRADDTFVPLPDRVSFARAQNADLFISLHADSSPNREACGASVYTLSEHGANRAQNLMAAQNWDLDLGGGARDGVVGDILVDLAQRETTNRSAEFAEMVIPNLRRVSPLLVSSHRNAGFFVLLAPDVPAVLIETGFLSNASDERRLDNPRERQAVAAAIAAAIDTYFQTRGIVARA